VLVLTCKSSSDAGATKQQHGCHNDVSQDAKVDEGHVCSCAPACLDDLTEGVCLRCFTLQLDCKDAKQQHLNSSTTGVPEGTTDAILPNTHSTA
jgi:hypothetical protein